ncbi:hypothetical protein [Teichococcus oryzae]|uniref:Uncharacterized protein n=1 Tax=Teichococcus oryzae TaxID=1608942 RepID=A0A5B2TND2_9PROT|nr:hypothetical protein [Pseudoroseomonas oryzae]KAA2215150.1 hypothetical protein F0Q34_05670 [Pseudoroseomonas oryzae]
MVGLLMLLRGNAAGAACFAPTREAALRSFRVAILCAPMFLVARLIARPEEASARFLTAEITGFVASWPAYALAALVLCRFMGREALWPRWIAVWNWTNLAQYILMVTLLAFGLLVPEGWVLEAGSLMVIGYVLWLQWFSARAALEVTGFQAAAFVMLDLMVSLLLSGVVADLSRG